GDVTPDWYPFVGPRSGIAGYADFSGGSGHGFKIAPSIARELADWLLTGKVADDFRQFSHDRVAAGKLFVQSFGGDRGELSSRASVSRDPGSNKHSPSRIAPTGVTRSRVAASRPPGGP